MKILNQPIKVMAIFHPDGRIQPIRFRIDEEAVTIEKIIKSYEEKLVGNKRVVFVCLHNEKDIYELKYEIDSNIWFLFKK